MALFNIRHKLINTKIGACTKNPSHEGPLEGGLDGRCAVHA